MDSNESAFMKSRLFKTCACASTVLFLGFAGLCIYTWVDDPNPRANESGIHWSYVSLGNEIHVAVTRDWGGNLVLFNQTLPYTGSVLSLAGDKTINERGLTGCGIYFRLIKNTVKDTSWWTLMVSFWYPIIIFGILPSAFVVKRLCSVKSPVQSEAAKT